MREILFRGKREDNGEWIFGSLHIEYGEADRNGSQRLYYRILGKRGECDYVGPETVGQYTGLTDKNGTKIFEGDIIHELDGSMDNIARVVRWDIEYMEYKCPLVKKHWCYGNNDCSLWLMQRENIEVIGNIHDNLELIGGREDGD